MKFFEEHFTSHHLKRNPHKWLTALVLSPIHHAEMRYKHHYHLKFAHAKKLFFFDVLLLLSTLLLICSTLFWWLYDPTVTELVHLEVTATVENERLRSGDDIQLAISAHNDSDVTLQHPKLMLGAPAGFALIDASLPYETNGNGTTAIALDALAPGDSTMVTIDGRYYGIVDTHESFQTMLIYTQDGRTSPESDVHRLFLTAREPSVSIAVEAPEYIVPGVSVPIQIALGNEHPHESLPRGITVLGDDIVWTYATEELSETNDSWDFGSLEESEKRILPGTILLSPSARGNTIDLQIASEMVQNNDRITEYVHTELLSIARPDVLITTSWAETYSTIGSNALLTLSITNTGNVPLENAAVTYAGKSVALSDSLAPNETIPLTMSLGLAQSAIEDGADGAVFAPVLTFSSAIAGIENYEYTKSITAVPLLVGTTASLSQSARYYTAEGDQLGRGPLPPQVGKETKYWIFSQINNTVGTLQDAVFSATLAPGVIWTGKSSVTRGTDIAYDTATGVATWRSRIVNPYETVGIYFEVAVEPSPSMQGTVPQLITGTSFSATDPYVDADVFASFGSIDASLLGDTIGQAKGTAVQ